ncbi:hypothetical protein P7K49_025521 [Saguinus oedipus]|uniref:Suppressor of tumorigenicity 7 protein n=1 Tax=Saguinus oedipus TaxID=9490 RepID=A0ABQ9UJP3_SAGOE|nr:hypothetical protein P7K49_025521 [Saguinus oedipus]
MAEAGTGFLEQLKSCIVWSWTYLWTVWFFIVLFLVYILRVPLKINDNLSTASAPPPPRKVKGRGRGRAAGHALGDAPGPAHRTPAATRGGAGRLGARWQPAAFTAPLRAARLTDREAGQGPRPPCRVAGEFPGTPPRGSTELDRVLPHGLPAVVERRPPSRPRCPGGDLRGPELRLAWLGSASLVG